MASDKSKNRFKTNHPEIDPNDPAVLMTAGLISQAPQDEPKQEEVVTTPAEPEKPTQAEQEPVAPDLFADLTVEKNISKSYSFYLKVENVKKLEKAAKKNGVSVSKLLDHIISKL